MLDDLTLRSRILEVVNMIITLEGGPVPVVEVRVVTAPAFFDSTFGTSLLTESGQVVMRVAVQRPGEDVADTVLHETAHTLLGPDHVDHSDHGADFQNTYRRIRDKYFDVVLEEVTRP